MNHSTFTVCFTKTFSCDSLYLFYIVVIRLFFFFNLNAARCKVINCLIYIVHSASAQGKHKNASKQTNTL